MNEFLTRARCNARHWVRGWRRRRRGSVSALPPAAPVASWTFQCNLCGAQNTCPLAALSREAESCARCGSTVRLRSVAELAVREAVGSDTPLFALPPRKDVVALGFSDEPIYADWLAAKFRYENTWFHRSPRLDATHVPEARFGRYDLVIASDVFEHVAPPVGRAFVNARRLLRPGGKFIFTAPFGMDDDTREHFPDLHDWTLSRRDGRFVLENRTAHGDRQTFDALVFHGGPGAALELRLFSRRGLEREFAAAGFTRLRIADEPVPRFGIHWPDPWSVPIVAYTD
jgi:SAM-dependent methyltransferase